MNAVREAWTDERLDDLNQGMHREFDQVRAEIKDLRAHTDAGFDSVNARFDALNARFDAMQRTMIGGFAAIVAAVVAAGIF